jgi:hypothetical protein
MRNAMRRMRYSLVIVVALWAASLSAQQMTQPVAAPVPPALSNSKSVFISNAGADIGLFPHPFSGDPDRGYNQFYAALQAWGRYQLTSDPSQADLVMELQLLGPTGPANPNKVKGASDPLPTFHLRIYDRKTHYLLWALNEAVGVANLQKTHDRNFDDALDALVDDLRRVTTSGASTRASQHDTRGTDVAAAH